MKPKPVTDLTADDLARFPVWEYDIGGESLPGRDETWVVPVPDLPVSSLSGRVAGVSLRIGGRERTRDVRTAAQLHTHEHVDGVIDGIREIDDGRVEGEQADLHGRKSLEDPRHHRAVDDGVDHGAAAIDRHDDVPREVPLHPRAKDQLAREELAP